MRLPASKLGRTVLGIVVGGVAGLLMAIGLIVLCVVTCIAVYPEGTGYDAEPWAMTLTVVAFWVGLMGGPLLGAIIGARRMRRGPCPPCTTDSKPAQ